MAAAKCWRSAVTVGVRADAGKDLATARAAWDTASSPSAAIVPDCCAVAQPEARQRARSSFFMVVLL
jgi:hypothetical protein